MGDLTSPPEPANRVQTPGPKAPHVPAAFINVIDEEGTKQQAVRFLQETWNDYCESQRKVRQLETDRAELIDLVRSMTCPHPLLDNRDADVDYCIDRKQCGCMIGIRLSRLSPAPQPTEGNR